ncbi:hypothetical protein FA04_28580 (plasmid) [Ensifer adhaerens]|nr:hypothetical protein FA04_28580 [Ensifer adhaerens]KQX24943.1 hypothetical protein ASD01_26545 [Ensifer sp. Root423]
MLCVLLQDLTQRRSKRPLAAAFRTALLIRSYLIVIAVTPRASIALGRLSLRGPAFLLGVRASRHKGQTNAWAPENLDGWLGKDWQRLRIYTRFWPAANKEALSKAVRLPET